MERKNNKKYFLGVTRSESDWGSYDVYFINDTEEMVTVSMASGSYATEGDDVIKPLPLVGRGERLGQKDIF